VRYLTGIAKFRRESVRIMKEKFTALILSYNEAPNIGRTLEQLRWARDIVIVDSLSDDETIAIANSFPQVRVFP